MESSDVAIIVLFYVFFGGVFVILLAQVAQECTEKKVEVKKEEEGLVMV